MLDSINDKRGAKERLFLVDSASKTLRALRCDGKYKMQRKTLALPAPDPSGSGTHNIKNLSYYESTRDNISVWSFNPQNYGASPNWKIEVCNYLGTKLRILGLEIQAQLHGHQYHLTLFCSLFLQGHVKDSAFLFPIPCIPHFLDNKIIQLFEDTDAEIFEKSVESRNQELATSQKLTNAHRMRLF